MLFATKLNLIIVQYIAGVCKIHRAYDGVFNRMF